MATSKELREKLGPLATQIREMADLVHKEDRDFTAEEKEKWDKLNTEAEQVEAQIERAERAEWATERVERLQQPANQDRRIGHDDIDTWGENRGGRERETPEGTPSQPQRRAATREYHRAFSDWLSSGDPRELRALQVDVDTTGGYITASEQFVNELIKAVDNEVFVRQWATKYTVTSADSLGVPTLDTDPDDPDWTGEITSAAEEKSMTFGKRTLTPHPLSKLIKVSKSLLRRSVLPVDQLVRDRLTYKFGTTHENSFLNGSGSNQPLGLFTASDMGISTNRDMSTGNSTTAVTADNLINAKYTLKGQYHANARWIFHRNLIRDIRKLKDGNEQYLWNAGLAGDRPSTILDIPYSMSEYAPATMTAGSYIGILGDFRFYWIVDSLAMDFQRLDELYARTNQVGFLARMETDAMPVLEEAFVRVQLAAS